MNIATEKKEIVIKQLAKASDKQGYEEICIPCVGKFCRVKLYREKQEVERLVADDFADPKSCMCSYCQEHDGRGKYYDLWVQTCPKIFQTGETKTDISRFPEAWAKIKNWGETLPQHNQSLYVFGETGKCKSRMMFLVLYHSIAARGKSFKVYAGGALRNALCEAYSARFDKKDKSNLLSELTDIDVLVFDDFGQDAMTETMLSDLWSVLDNRFSACKPTIFLSNFAPRNLKERYGKIFSMDSLIRRIEDYSQIIRV